MGNISSNNVDNGNNDQRIFDLDSVVVVYNSPDSVFEQPVSDVPEVGNMVHPDTGEELELNYAVTIEENGARTIRDLSTVSIVHTDSEYKVGDIIIVGSLVDPETGESIDIDHVIVEDNGNKVTYDTDKVILVYSEEGSSYGQEVSTIINSGTLIHPETGDDLEVDYVVVHNGDDSKVYDPSKVYLVYTDHDCELEQPVSDIVYSGTLIHPETEMDMNITSVLTM